MVTFIFTFWIIFSLRSRDALSPVAGLDVSSVITASYRRGNGISEAGAHPGLQGGSEAGLLFLLALLRGLAQDNFQAVILSCLQRYREKGGQEEETGIYPVAPELFEVPACT